MEINITRFEARSIAIAYRKCEDDLTKISLESLCKKLFPHFKEDKVFYQNYTGNINKVIGVLP